MIGYAQIFMVVYHRFAWPSFFLHAGALAAERSISQTKGYIPCTFMN